jgi:AcrR family transcriptional regulator
MSRTRLTAAERHGQLVTAAVTAFSEGGYAGTTTDQVARLAGVSQPYVIRLFGTKQQLFIAAIGHTVDRVEEHFRAAAAQGEPTLETLATSYNELIAERELITLLLHGFAAAGDPAIGPVAREGFGRIYTTVRELTGATAEEARDFMGMGMLCTVLGSLRLVGPGAVEPEPWAADMVGSLALEPTE